MKEPATFQHVVRNSLGQWIVAGGLYAAVFCFFMWYHAVRGRPYSLFVANKCVAIAAAILIGMSLALGPLARRWSSWQRWLPARRSLGLFGAYASVPHALLSLWGWLPLNFPSDGQFTWAWYVTHWPCLVFGALTLVVLMAIASQSYPGGLQRFGQACWLGLQKLNWLALVLIVSHLVFKGTFPNWIKWWRTFDKPFPPGAFTTALFLVMVLVLKLTDVYREARLRRVA